ncbi:MAG: 30S ribosomal protein S5 [Candidatus Diapherotrites archaeon]|uniref:Small ribosomal subunit protein uS5 n=1 Tax=Candidatus Iainarchaeum sp. TaxID=3101447 RepID=A0A2D6LPB8_9ARCH|nr:30S ribosomal protein S5 [Candidatus Diapherotrites archaeon]|tara:strand:+ start:5727 stop:6431 length:705 start_codon:yes stop_codon:yes gene_type:complete
MARRPRRVQTEEERTIKKEEDRLKIISDWVPKTAAGKLVKAGEITSLDDFFTKGHRIMEPQIIDTLVPDLKDKMVDFKKTTKVTRQGRNFSFRAAVLIGDGQSYIGLGTAKDKEKFPAINKATRNAKLSIKKVRKACGSWECRCKESHSVPFNVIGKSSSVRVKLLPAPKGTGLVAGDNIKEVLKFAGVRDAWSKSEGNTASTLDFVQAAIDALAATSRIRVSDDINTKLEVKR